MTNVPTVSIIVPTYREAENLPVLVDEVATTLKARGWFWELIVVDDNSPDETPRVLEELSQKYPQFRYKIRTNERGLSSAVLAGIAISRYDYVLVMDADLSHPPTSIPDVVMPLVKDEADFVIGSRYVEGGKTEDWSRLRWLNSYGATLLAKPLIGEVRDPMAGFFALRRSALYQADPLNPIGYKIALELMVKTHAERVREVPITFRNRVRGESKLTMKEQFRYLEHLSRLYDYVYPKASPRLKFLIAAGCGAVAAYGTVFGLNLLNIAPFVSVAVGMIAMILVTLAFFARYVRTQRDFILMRHPFREFAAISLAEFLTGWAFAMSTQTTNMALQLGMGLTVLLLVRYTLRKVFLHDLRGIRGTPKPAATLRLTFSAQPSTNATPAATA